MTDFVLLDGTGIRLRHMTCVRCRRHVAATEFFRIDGEDNGPGSRIYRESTMDSWGGVFFESPGFLCDCCLNECPNCRGGNE